jgi:hypothetical protein
MVMNRIEIAVMKPQAALNRFVDTWRRRGGGRSGYPQISLWQPSGAVLCDPEKRLEVPP